MTRRTKALLSIILSVVCIELSYVLIRIGYAVPNTIRTDVGQWKNIDLEGTDLFERQAVALFCAEDGHYAGHVLDSGQGWFIAMIHSRDIGSFIDESSAKKRIEKECH